MTAAKVLFCPGYTIACNTSFLHKNGANWCYQKLFTTEKSPKCYCGRGSAPDWDS